MHQKVTDSRWVRNEFSDGDEQPFVTMTIGCCEKATEERQKYEG
jgi:hypothetical protein